MTIEKLSWDKKMNKEKEEDSKDERLISVLTQIKKELSEIKNKLEKQIVDKKQIKE